MNHMGRSQFLTVQAFGRVVQQLRERKGMNQLALTKAAGLANGTVSRIEHGDVNPTLTTFLALIKGLKVKPEELLNPLPAMVTFMAQETALYNRIFEPTLSSNQVNGAKGGSLRWKGVSKADRRVHMQMMRAARSGHAR